MDQWSCFNYFQYACRGTVLTSIIHDKSNKSISTSCPCKTKVAILVHGKEQASGFRTKNKYRPGVQCHPGRTHDPPCFQAIDYQWQYLLSFMPLCRHAFVVWHVMFLACCFSCVACHVDVMWHFMWHVMLLSCCFSCDINLAALTNFLRTGPTNGSKLCLKAVP